MILILGWRRTTTAPDTANIYQTRVSNAALQRLPTDWAFQDIARSRIQLHESAWLRGEHEDHCQTQESRRKLLCVLTRNLSHSHCRCLPLIILRMSISNWVRFPFDPQISGGIFTRQLSLVRLPRGIWSQDSRLKVLLWRRRSRHSVHYELTRISKCERASKKQFSDDRF